MTIQGGGNVGIGTATPNEQLEITGNFRLPSTTATTGIIMSDGNPFIHSIGTKNLFAGKNAGKLTITGIGWNTGVGHRALQEITSGCCNTATGAFALSINTTGSNNTAFGRNALSDNTTGFDNTAIGYFADVSSGTITNATAIGANAVVDASNKIRLGDSAVTVVETSGDVFVDTQGFGI